MEWIVIATAQPDVRPLQQQRLRQDTAKKATKQQLFGQTKSWNGSSAMRENQALGSEQIRAAVESQAKCRANIGIRSQRYQNRYVQKNVGAKKE